MISSLCAAKFYLRKSTKFCIILCLTASQVWGCARYPAHYNEAVALMKSGQFPNEQSSLPWALCLTCNTLHWVPGRPANMPIAYPYEFVSNVPMYEHSSTNTVSPSGGLLKLGWQQRRQKKIQPWCMCSKFLQAIRTSILYLDRLSQLSHWDFMRFNYVKHYLIWK